MKKRALLFAGQGAQVVGMGKDLYDHSAEVKDLYHEADKVLGFSLTDFSFEGPEEKLTDTSVCQPALYVHGLALLTVARELVADFQFSAAAGLSLGEYTAHAAVDTFSFSTGLELVYHRGRLMQHACEHSKGGMLTLIGATDEQAVAIAKEADLDAANFNCPGQIVLSGEAERIPEAVKIAKEAGIRKAIPLKVAGAYHSRLMKPAQVDLQPYLDKAEINTPAKTVMANVTGAAISDPADIRAKLAEQVCGSVRWESCVRALIAEGIEQFVEFGPGGVLAGMMRRIDSDASVVTIGTFEELQKHTHELAE